LFLKASDAGLIENVSVMGKLAKDEIQDFGIGGEFVFQGVAVPETSAGAGNSGGEASK
jgi:hypothetical protein